MGAGELHAGGGKLIAGLRGLPGGLGRPAIGDRTDERAELAGDAFAAPGFNRSSRRAGYPDDDDRCRRASPPAGPRREPVYPLPSPCEPAALRSRLNRA